MNSIVSGASPTLLNSKTYVILENNLVVNPKCSYFSRESS